MCATGALICHRLLLSLTVFEVFLSLITTAHAQNQLFGPGRMGPLTAMDPCRLFTQPNEDKMEFYSPMYPQHYPNNTECILKLQADYGYVIRIDFRDYFHLEPSDTCEFDFLEIRDGAHGYSDLMGKFCDEVFPPIITSKDQNLWLRFTSDDTIEYRGFRAVYQFIENTAIDRPEIQECYFQVSGIQGVITEQNISESRKEYSRTYNYPVDCTWIIEVKPNEKIYMLFEEFNLEQPNECDLNYVDIFDKDTDLRNRIRHYCGSVADSFATKTNILYFRYFSMPDTMDSKFRAWFTAYRDRISDDKDEDNPQCTPDEYDCDDATCIDLSLKCNGIKNCRHEYDEEGCNTLQNLKFDIRSEHIIIILTLGCGLLGGMCFAMCFNCIRKLIRDGRQIHENIRRSREQLEERSHTGMSTASSPRVVYRPTINEDGPCYISDAKTNGHPCIRPESESESEGDEDDDEVEEDDMEESCVEMRDCECQTRDSLLTQRDSVQSHLPMTPPPPPPPNRRPPGLPPLSPGHPPSVPTPPPPPGSHYGRAPPGPPSDHYGSYGRPPVPRHNDPYEVDDQSDDSYAQRYRAEAVIEMRDKGHYEPTKSPKTTPDVLATH